MSNICDTQYKVRGSRKALSDLWNALQTMEVNSKNVYLHKLAEHYGIDYEHRGISVRGQIYWAEFEDDEDGGLLSFDTESAWSACDQFFDELNKVLGYELSISYREVECGCEIFHVHDEGNFFPEECCVSASGGNFDDVCEDVYDTIGDAIRRNKLKNQQVAPIFHFLFLKHNFHCKRFQNAPHARKQRFGSRGMKVFIWLFVIFYLILPFKIQSIIFYSITITK